MRHRLIPILLFTFTTFAIASDFISSNLPIVIITTDNNPNTGNPQSIPDEPKVLGNMKIIYRPDGSRNYFTDQTNDEFLNYNGRIGIEIRGSSSQALDKKPYSLTTLQSDDISNNNVSILGMPKENDWVLNALAFDPSLIRDYLSYELSRKIGNYAARAEYCEVIINGKYAGLYLFMEKLKVDDNRINITKATTVDNNYPELTGGYITKCDKNVSGEAIAWSMANFKNGSVNFLHESPKPEEITSQQHNYIYKQFNSLKNVMNSQNSSISDGYPSIIDVPSFVDFMLLCEFASNPDAYQFSTFFHKDRNGKLRAGPIWDFNLTYGNDLFIWGYDRSHTNIWQFENGNLGAKFWKDLFSNSIFKCYLSKRWLELSASDQPLNYNLINKRIDELSALLSEAKVREHEKWNTLSKHTTNISDLKKWIFDRTSWLDQQINNDQACTNLHMPALVISKIQYNPSFSTATVSDNLEFVEITNNSNQRIDLSGIYFKELGFTYQFPLNSSIDSNKKIILASDSISFEVFYGFKPFGQYSRKLSNTTEKLVLCDAFGNTIDYVEYFSTLPWPIDANGKGSFLELINLNDDNNLSSSWTASNNLINGINQTLYDAIVVYPSMAQSSITIKTNNQNIESYVITNMIGKVVLIGNINTSQNINIDNLTANIYLIRINLTDGKTVVKKFIKL